MSVFGITCNCNRFVSYFRVVQTFYACIKTIANLNIQLSENSESTLKDKLDYLLMLKDSIYSGSFDGIDEFLEKYKEDKL